jgi:hypothetical protein
LFEDLSALVRPQGGPRGNEYGQGPNWKIRTIRKALEELGLSGDLLRHGIRRQVFLAPLASNWAEFLRGEAEVVEPIGRPLTSLVRYFLDRWAIPRASRRPHFKDWIVDDMRLTPQIPGAPRVQRLF